MSTHQDDAEMLLTMTDHQAFAADTSDPWKHLAGVAGAVATLLAAQVHATLAVADAIREKSS